MARQDFFKVKVITARSNQGQTIARHNYTPYPMFLPNINFLHLTVSEIWPGQDFSRLRSLRQGQRVKSRSNYDEAQLHFLTNVPTKYELPTHYSFRDMARTRFIRSRSLRQGQKSNQG